MAVLVASAAIAAADDGPSRSEATRIGDAAVEIELVPSTTLHGVDDEEYYHLAGVGDVNGDGITDLITDYSVRPRAPNAELWFQIVPGRRDWPELQSRLDLEGVVPIVSSQIPARRVLPDRPNFYLAIPPVTDMNLDGIGDIVVTELVSLGSAFSWSVGVYYGRSQLWPVLDVNAIPPDLRVRQPRVPLTENPYDRTPVPDHLIPGDFDGDGAADLLVVACGMRGDRYRRGDESRWYLYLARDGALADVELSESTASSVVHGMSGDGPPCRGEYTGVDFGATQPSFWPSDINGDGRTDLLYVGWDTRRSRREVRLVLAPESWPPTAETEDLIEARFEASVPLDEYPYLPRVLPDITGDEWPEIALSGRLVWFGGAVPSGTIAPESADVRILGGTIPVDGVLDVNGDRMADLVIEVEPHHPFGEQEWRVLAGPIGPTGSVDVQRDHAFGDYRIVVPEASAADYWPEWMSGDYNGDGIGDAAITYPSENSPTGLREAGVLRLYLGPLAAPGPAVATPTPRIEPPRSECPDEYEPDDTKETASRLPLRAVQRRNFDTAGDADVVRFELEPGAYVLRTFSLEPMTDTRIELMDAGGRRRIAVNDDARNMAPASRIEWTVQERTAYLARIADIDALTARCDRGYSLVLHPAD